ncbi:hypothetical protein PybrP1_008043 [[Pythium] brassicae (nom. inval.)]|nr:hypothetical protein PybrP1_008043 [[Pythium] brassicae (nom. inval.)]
MTESSQPSSGSTASDSRPQLPPLPEPLTLRVQDKAIVKYIDIRPAGYSPDTTPTIVLVHGCPGSYKDFRHIIPLLQERARVVALTLPGFEDSEVIDLDNRFEHVTALGIAEITYAALSDICGDAKHVFLVGHSLGGHTVTSLAALNLERRKLSVRGVGFLSSAGHRRHYPEWGIWSVLFGSFDRLIRARLPVLTPGAEAIARAVITKGAGFPDSDGSSHFAATVVRLTSTDYDLVNEHCRQIAHIPAFAAWAKDDHIISEEIFLRKSAESHPGPRFAFETGGHNIQKTKASILGPELAQWAADIAVQADDGSSSRSGAGVVTQGSLQSKL